MQNNMLRSIHGLKISDRGNMLELRTKIKIMSINQMTIYHTVMEVFNILHNSSSEQISGKYSHHNRHSVRKNANNFVRVPEQPQRRKCTGFTYCGAKIYNSLPTNITETQDRTIFKKLVKNWIWDEIPSYWQNLIYKLLTIYHTLFISIFYIFFHYHLSSWLSLDKSA